MKWELEEQENYVVVRPTLARLDSAVAPEFRTFVSELSNEQRKQILLDLTNVEFMDSSGLGAVVGCYKLTKSVGGLLVCNVQKQVKDIFRLTHMDRIFEVNDSFETCVERLAA